jgi:hypothetical protein
VSQLFLYVREFVGWWGGGEGGSDRLGAVQEGVTVWHLVHVSLFTAVVRAVLVSPHFAWRATAAATAAAAVASG